MLWVRNRFLRGLRSPFKQLHNNTPYDVYKSPNKLKNADYVALKSDWDKIVEDFKKVIPYDNWIKNEGR